MTPKTFQTLGYHTDVVRGEYLLYIARLSQVAILNLQRCVFCIWKLIYSFTITCLFFFEKDVLRQKKSSKCLIFFKFFENKLDI